MKPKLSVASPSILALEFVPTVTSNLCQRSRPMSGTFRVKPKNRDLCMCVCVCVSIVRISRRFPLNSLHCLQTHLFLLCKKKFEVCQVRREILYRSHSTQTKVTDSKPKLLIQNNTKQFVCLFYGCAPVRPKNFTKNSNNFFLSVRPSVLIKN